MSSPSSFDLHSFSLSIDDEAAFYSASTSEDDEQDVESTMQMQRDTASSVFDAVPEEAAPSPVPIEQEEKDEEQEGEGKEIVTQAMRDYLVMFDDLVGPPVDFAFEEVPDYVLARTRCLFSNFLRQSRYKDLDSVYVHKARSSITRRERRRLLFARDEEPDLVGDKCTSSEEAAKPRYKLLYAEGEQKLLSLGLESFRVSLIEAARYWSARKLCSEAKGRFNKYYKTSIEANIAELGLVRGVEVLRKRREFFSSLYHHYVKPADPDLRRAAIDEYTAILWRVDQALEHQDEILLKRAVGIFLDTFKDKTDLSVPQLMPGYKSCSSSSSSSFDAEQDGAPASVPIYFSSDVRAEKGDQPDTQPEEDALIPPGSLGGSDLRVLYASLSAFPPVLRTVSQGDIPEEETQDMKE